MASDTEIHKIYNAYIISVRPENIQTERSHLQTYNHIKKQLNANITSCWYVCDVRVCVNAGKTVYNRVAFFIIIREAVRVCVLQMSRCFLRFFVDGNGTRICMYGCIYNHVGGGGHNVFRIFHFKHEILNKHEYATEFKWQKSNVKFNYKITNLSDSNVRSQKNIVFPIGSILFCTLLRVKLSKFIWLHACMVFPCLRSRSRALFNIIVCRMEM